MKKLSIILIFFTVIEGITISDYSDFFDLTPGNIFIYNCTDWVAAPPYINCTGNYRLKIVITDSINHAGKFYYRYTKELLHYSGTCNFRSFMFPFYVGNYSSIRIDKENGMIYYYNPFNGCAYSPNETLIDSLSSALNDTVSIICAPTPYSYKCIDTTGKRKYFDWGQQGQIRREYVRGIGLVNNYQYRSGASSFIDEQTLVGRVVNGIVYGDTGFFLVGTQQISSEIPLEFSLSQNYPNPFNPVTKIKFQIPYSPLTFGEGQGVGLKIYNTLGREVQVLVNELLQPGTYEVDWDASNYPSGVYFYELTSGDFIQTKKMVLVK